MERELQETVRRRAQDRCEYCRFPESFSELPFQIDHVVARKHGGATETENLALACCFCNRFKGPNISGIDPEAKQVVDR
jgi:5-methylcytosine-specific restriction endonuclease McrA